MKLPGEELKPFPAMQRPVTTDAINASFRTENRERFCSRCDRKAKSFRFVIRNLQIWNQRAAARSYDGVDDGSRIT
jgi:hypothetical protein